MALYQGMAPTDGASNTVGSPGPSPAFLVGAGKVLRVTPLTGISGVVVEASTDTYQAVANGTATFTAWPAGTLAVADTTTQDVAQQNLFVRVTPTGGNATVVVDNATASEIAAGNAWGGAVTDSSGGTASATIASTVGVYTVAIPIVLAQIAGTGDVLTNYTVGHRFKLVAWQAAVVSAVTTAAKAATLNLEIGATNVTGGSLALTSAACTPLGAIITPSAITAANTGTAADNISIEAASVTAFAEGQVIVLLKIQNLDIADAFATLADRLG